MFPVKPSQKHLKSRRMNIADKITLHRDHEVHEMLMAQVCTKNLKRIFKVDPEEVWLRDMDNGTAYFPSEDGSFNLKDSGVKYFQDLIVEGPNARAAGNLGTPGGPSQASSGSASNSLSSGSVQQLPSLPPLISPSLSSGKNRDRGGNFSLKITKANMTFTSAAAGKGRSHGVEFQPIAQIYVEINEQCANVAYVKACLQKKWGNEYTLVTMDGVELEDCPGTEGLPFWRAPKRRFYAIEEQQMAGTATKRPRAKTANPEAEGKKAKLDLLSSIKEDVGNLSEIKESILGMEKKLTEIMEVNEKMNIPTGLHRSLMDTFMCKVCRNFPMKPPLIHSKCCKSVIGCEGCVNKWYTGDEALTKVCPLCGSARGYNETAQILGFDEFVQDLERMMGESNQDHSSTSSSS